MLSVTQIQRVIDNELNLHPSQERNEAIQAAAEKIYDLVKPDHDIHVTAAALDNEITSTLIDMAVATVLATLIEEEGGGRSSIVISPMSMDHMIQNYLYTSTKEGMLRTVGITMRDDSPLKGNHDAWNEPSNRHSLVDKADTNFVPPVAPGSFAEDITIKPQAEPKEHNRPEWVVAVMEETLTFLRCHDQADANRQIREPSLAGKVAYIENRWCLHVECPSTGCNEDALQRDNPEVSSHPTYE